MPVVSCPLGAVCDKGTDGGIWKTDNVSNELVKISIEAHVKYAHQAAAAGAAAPRLVRGGRIPPQRLGKRRRAPQDLRRRRRAAAGRG